MYSVSQKKNPPWGFLTFYPKRLGIFNQSFYTRIVRSYLYARLQIFIQLSPTATKLCHVKRNHLTNFYISLELQLVNLLTEQMTSLLTSCHMQHVSWHYKSVCCLLINFCEWVKYPTTTSSQGTNGQQTHQTSTHLTTICGVTCDASSISQTSVKAKDHPRAKMHCSRSGMTCHRQRSTKLSTTFANVWSSERVRTVRFGRWWTFWAYDVNWVVALNMAQRRQSCN